METNLGNKRKIIEIELITENCEEIHLNIKDVYFFRLNKISKQLIFCDYNVDKGEVNESLICNDFEVWISNPKSIPYNDAKNRKITIYDRLLEFQDISIVNLKFDDGTYEGFYLEYDEDHQENNKLQTHEYDGEMIKVVVSRDRSAKVSN
ncbi:hypothetical protein NQ043_09715 [Staphylococcus hyicus]|uniref:hypothetical protein n=1 Tax=Staphylococcus hyicus TaxID=1284 RepID=UPI00211C64FF|nr:hypothetical protein [Staphylococcus hyicus]MCQ9301403.1 hypothetical protein [Staphylococcus hyicus]